VLAVAASPCITTVHSGLQEIADWHSLMPEVWKRVGQAYPDIET
jgi:hypothetical protein